MNRVILLVVLAITMLSGCAFSVQSRGQAQPSVIAMNDTSSSPAQAHPLMQSIGMMGGGGSVMGDGTMLARGGRPSACIPGRMLRVPNNLARVGFEVSGANGVLLVPCNQLQLMRVSVLEPGSAQARPAFLIPSGGFADYGVAMTEDERNEGGVKVYFKIDAYNVASDPALWTVTSTGHSLSDFVPYEGDIKVERTGISEYRYAQCRQRKGICLPLPT